MTTIRAWLGVPANNSTMEPELRAFRRATTAELGAIRSDRVLAPARKRATRDAQALFIARSKLPTRGIIPQLCRELNRPVWSSIKATAWAALGELFTTGANVVGGSDVTYLKTAARADARASRAIASMGAQND